MRNKKRVFFVPGITGIDDGGWPGWLDREFTKSGFEFRILQMPDIMYPEVHQWVDFLIEQNIKVDKNTYFIGHSLGCITIARYLETLQSGKKAGGCVFVAGFCSIPSIPLLSRFCTLPLDFSKVKEHAEDFVVVLSDNDHIIPQINSEELAGKIGARIIIEHNKGHFRSDTKELHSVLNSILEMDQMNDEETEIKRLKRLKVKF
jgi:uncharacterized protein